MRAALSIAIAALGLPACGAAATTGGPTTTPASTTTTTVAPTTSSAPPSTAYQPTRAEASAGDAAARLLATWRNADRISAAEVATPAAVGALFAHQPVGLQPRGCSDGQPPLDCTYADTRGASPTLYDLSVAPAAPGRWYVVTVAVATP